jgi:hypothetical protein
MSGLGGALQVQTLLNNPTGTLEAQAVAASAGTVLTAGAGGFSFQLPTPYVAPQYTFATLPASPFVGETAVVTDATVNTWGTAVTAGAGSDVVLTWWNGSNWVVIGK